MSRRKTFVLVILLVLVVLLGGTSAFWMFRRVRGESHWTVLLGDDTTRVVVCWSHRPIIFEIRHMLVIGGGDWRYDVELKGGSGKDISFVTKEEPRAIWLLNGQLYVASCGRRWHFARIDSRGHLQEVTRNALPPGPKPFNLTVDPISWEKMFEAGHMSATTSPGR